MNSGCFGSGPRKQQTAGVHVNIYDTNIRDKFIEFLAATGNKAALETINSLEFILGAAVKSSIRNFGTPDTMIVSSDTLKQYKQFMIGRNK